MVSNISPAKVKLQKYLIHHKLAQSNKHVRKLITEGKVYVNGVEARSVSIKVALDGDVGSVFVKTKPEESSQPTESSSAASIPPAASLARDHETTRASTEHRCQPLSKKDANPCILFYKPCGMICTTTVNAEFDTLVNIAPKPLPLGFHPVGRLDQHSHGLLLCSCDGRLTSALLSPRSQIVREYTVIVEGDVGEEAYEHIIREVKKGVHTKYGTFQGCILDTKRDVDRDYAHLQCDPTRGCRKDDYEDTETWKNSGADRDCNKAKISQILSSLTIQVEEGKKRMVRRLFAALDLPVLDLRRNKYGGMQLDAGLLPGQWRFADDTEVAWCRKLIQTWNDGGKGWDNKWRLLSNKGLDDCALSCSSSQTQG